ncbi:MAG: nucleotidyltransferase domain-containing protein [Cyanobacteria bacterium P01_C01_bin.120]
MKGAVQSKREVLNRLHQSESTIRQLGVKRLGLFGSFIHDQVTAESDVDFLVEFEPGQKSFDSFMALSFFLEELLQRPVEIVTTESLSRHIGPRILQSVEYVA